ncbi:MAG: hypothetical protein JNK25_09790 [Phycisphaerae bacterium]|nr:hypothetical protein [Phycisphaerae bacterium]
MFAAQISRTSLVRTRIGFLAAAAGSTLAQPGLPCPPTCPTNQQVQICYEAGRVDNFAAPVDPTTPRPFFASLLSTYAISKPFDDARVNAVCGTTFQNLPCGIVSATLEIRLRAEDDIPDNDSIYLQWLGGTFAWASNIKNLPGAGGTWNPGQTQTFTLNLNTLSGGLIGQMNSSNALDVLVSDDTTVEYARLTIRVCPCDGPARVYTVGVADNLAPGTEPTSRRPQLTAQRTLWPFLWKDCDDHTIDRGWGQTFQGLPSGIVRADFNILMMPSAGGASNDGIAFDLLNPGEPDAFSRTFNINTIAPPWTTNPLTNFYFNLGSTLPTTVCGLNLLGNFGDRTFDVYVQDDTVVDAARLRVWPCPPMRRLWGTPIDTTGTAVLETGPGGLPSVRCNPATGEDALRIDAHGTESQRVDFPPGAFDAMPVGSQLIIATLDDEDGDGQLASSWARGYGAGVGKAQPGSASRVAPGPNGTGTCTGPRIRHSQTGASRELCLTPDQYIDVLSDDISSVGHERRSGEPYVYHAIKFREAAAMILPDGTVFHGDTIEFFSPAADEDPAPEYMELSWGLLPGGTPAGEFSLPIAGISSVVNDVAHHAVGPRCILNTNPGSVTLSNIGDSGEDGAEFTLGEAESFSTTVSPNCGGDDSAQCDSEMTIRLTATGRLTDGTSADVARVRTTGRVTGFFDIWTEFPTFPGLPGSIGTIATILDENDAEVGEFEIPDGTALRCANGQHIKEAIISCYRESPTRGGGPEIIVRNRVRNYSIYSVPGLPPLTGNAVALRSLMPAGVPLVVPQSLTSVRLTGTGMAEIDLTGQSIVPLGSGVPCPADFNQDGGIDGADVDAFYQAWEAGDASADVNADGGIDGGDVETFFEAWENGGC